MEEQRRELVFLCGSFTCIIYYWAFMSHKHQEIQCLKTKTAGISPTTIKDFINRIRAGFKNKHNYIPTSPTESSLTSRDWSSHPRPQSTPRDPNKQQNSQSSRIWHLQNLDALIHSELKKCFTVSTKTYPSVFTNSSRSNNTTKLAYQLEKG